MRLIGYRRCGILFSLVAKERRNGKMTTLTLEMPDEIFAATRNGPDGLKREFRLAAAATWYREARISQEVAAQIAGLGRTDFLLALARMGEDSFIVDFSDLDKELSHG
jgi:predicted HTH domain antitoxin